MSEVKNAPFLEVDDLKITYVTDLETVYAVNGISFKLEKGQTLGFVGETGAGKTTMALSLLRLLPERTGKVTNGDIRIEGRSIFDMSDHELRELRGGKIAMIFQDPMTSLNPVMTVGDQIGESIMIHNPEMDKEQVKNRINEVLNMVGISENRVADYPHQFSGGMKQRVVIAMALACNPSLIIADEPTTALDVTIQAQVISMMRNLRDTLGTAMIMITHDLGIVAQTCDNVAIIYAGHIIEMGTAEDIFCADKHHPYTVGLFGSIPNLNVKTRRLNPIVGLMPDPTQLPDGCPFAPRCDKCMPICQTQMPGVYQSGTHSICCHLFANPTKEEQ
ncbi:MAG: ABC transporter ATP-binding protein [bacterium]|nr:ABC transporter ATP-binding protein [bacterium]